MDIDCYVLDSQALSLAALRDRAMTARITEAHRSGTRVVTSSMTLIEAYHGQVRRAAWVWAMSRVVVEPVTRDVAEAAIEVLEAAGLHGHKYAVGAALAVVAARQPGHVAVFTSDEDDMRKLCGPQVLVRPV
ncbi:PIN domain-containing protein [Streptomyces sp. NBC_00859]|uniref:PIN domain-containing protein n=1 Tax=Streptomyces sp. NBC_00859 TaxID=2903682 RepID=UPI00386980B9